MPSNSGEEHILGVATSTGLLSIYKVRDEIILQKHFRLADSHVLITSFAWHPYDFDVVATAHSTGAVVVYKIDINDINSKASAGHLHHQTPLWSAEVARHSEAAWHVAWTNSATRILHGGDDMALGWTSTPRQYDDIITVLQLVCSYIVQPDTSFRPNVLQERSTIC